MRECPRQESNLHPALRRRVLYPLSYEGARRPAGCGSRRVTPLLPLEETGERFIGMKLIPDDADDRRDAL